MKTNLPIDSRIPEILQGLRSDSGLILQASPGSGKTTRVPPALLNEPWAKGKEIWVLVPRRLAAKMAAFRVAEEMDEEVGATVGYQFRLEKVMGRKTRLKFLTEGMLLRLVISDPALSNVAAVVLDEFHERHLHSDVALAYLKWLQGTKRPDLKLLIMSATLETQALSGYLNKAPIIALEASLHPVRMTYLPRPSSERLEFLVCDAVQQAVSTSRGDILAFLPGMAEIRRAENSLLERFKDEIVVVPLHGDLSREEQSRAFREFPKPKVILATNIAETSLTFNGVTTVIDTGLHRQAAFSWWSGIPTLKTKNISKASAIQRAGRAGRTGPGQCLRLYTQSDFEGRPGFEVPEIRRSDLAQTLLEIKGLGVTSIQNYPWFEPPAPKALEAAVLLLFELGAVAYNDLEAPITSLGRRMLALPLHPRLSRMLMEAEKRKVLPEAALLAAKISEGEMEGKGSLSESTRRLRDQIVSFFDKRATGGSEKDLAFSLLTGFPDRVAQKRKGVRGAEVGLVFATGGSATVKNEGVVAQGDFFVIMDVQEQQRQGTAQSSSRVRSLMPIKPDWLLDLKSGLLSEKEELFWDKGTRRVLQVSRLAYGELTLSESREIPSDVSAAVRILLSEGLGLKADDAPRLTVSVLLKALEHVMDPLPIEESLSRLRLLSSQSFEGEELFGLVEKAFGGLADLKEVQPEVLAQRILDTQAPDVRKRIEALLPTHVTLAKGRRVKVHYRWDQKPWIGSRLQDFFGMKQGPSIMGGSMSLTLHLLAPNQRPVQVTQDLASFWQNAYPKIRKELSRRYPRHLWVENPFR